MPTAISIRANSSSRELLTANRTYFVRIDGNDANNGLTNTAGAAFLTIQKAVDVTASLDLGVYNVIIQLADGTYSGAISLKSIVGAGSITIRGNVTTPGNTIVTTSGTAPPIGGGVISNFAFASTYNLESFRLQAENSGWNGIYHPNKGSLINYKNLEFGANIGAHLFGRGGSFVCTGSYKIISNNIYAHFYLENGSSVIAEVQPTIITLTSNPTFTLAFYFSQQSYSYIASFPGYLSFSGSGTGKRFAIGALSHLTGMQNNLNFLPGNVAGTITGNSIYE